MDWNAQLYDQKHAFVFQYGEDVIELLNPRAGERILDLGCGTGHLTKLIQQEGADVLGIDSSSMMVDKAVEKFPDVDFQVANAEKLAFENEFDAVFSNAVLHWVKDQRALLDGVYKALKTGGRFVAEMGGKGNVGVIISALRKALQEFDYKQQAETRMWFFPSLGEYATMLERSGFKVTYAVHYDRDTLLNDQEEGVEKWIAMFGAAFLEGVRAEDKEQIIKKVTKMVEPSYRKGDGWYADYKRLRFIAVK
jgi:trans-aconitate methyltransferase